ncbi:MAG: ATP-dependent 6-phosphofructokinase [Dehalococcoidia bacterium]|nr:ATP-dependent 6-phosphofructokinase [Dehalococcoidia bacterium]
MGKSHRIAIITGGGDCPGINAVIRAVAKKAILEYGMEAVGIKDGYEGLIHNHHQMLQYEDVSGIITLGGTILGTSNKSNPYRYAVRKGERLEFEDLSPMAIANIRKLEVDCLVCIGGDGTLSIANRLFGDGVPVVGVPKTIDNDLRGTDITFGFDSAVHIATEGIDRVHTTAQSHHRVMIVEVMGRNAGWIALHAGVAGGGDIILLPEILYDMDIIVEKVKERNRIGKRFTIIVVAEGAKPEGGEVVVQKVIQESHDPIRLGGIGFVLGSQIEKLTGIEARTVVMGHLQRGGSPTPFDRVLATRLGTKAIDMAMNKQFGYMVGVRGNSLVEVPLEEVAKGQRTIPLDDPLLEAARSVGICFGD